MTLLTVLFIPAYAWLIQIWERPYCIAVSNLWFDSFFQSAYFVIITLTTVGYGDVYPNTNPGQFITLIIIITGAFWMGLLINAIQVIF
jgi:hypothetical protein